MLLLYVDYNQGGLPRPADVTSHVCPFMMTISIGSAADVVEGWLVVNVMLHL